MKRGGRLIYGGKLGLHSQTMIDYFQVTFCCIRSHSLSFFLLAKVDRSSAKARKVSLKDVNYVVESSKCKILNKS